MHHDRDRFWSMGERARFDYCRRMSKMTYETKNITSDYTIHQWKCYVMKLFDLFKMPKRHKRPKNISKWDLTQCLIMRLNEKNYIPARNISTSSIENVKWPMATVCQHSTYLVVFAATGTNQARVLSISSLIWGTVNWERGMIQIYGWNHVFQSLLHTGKQASNYLLNGKVVYLHP